MKKLPALTVYLILEFCAALFFGLVFNVNLIYHVTVVQLTPLQLVLVGTVLESSVFLFEIPTGVLADVKSRRLSILIGYAMIGVGFLIEGSLPFFATVLLAQVVWGVGYTFTSGATQAWIADEIGSEKAGQAFLRGAQAARVGGLIAIPISVGLGSLAITLPILLGGVLMLALAAFLIATMPEQGFTPAPREGRTSEGRTSEGRTSEDRTSEGRTSEGRTTEGRTTEGRTTWAVMRQTTVDALRLIRRRTMLLSLLAIGVFYGLYSEGYDRLWTPHFLENFASPWPAVQPVVWLGALNAIGTLLNLGVTEIARRRVDTRQTSRLTRILMLNAGVMVLALAGFGLAPTFGLAAAAFCIFGMARSLAAPLQTAWLNLLIDDPQVRATLFSVSSQSDAIGQIAGGPFLGAIGDHAIRAAFVASAALLSPVLPLYAVARKQEAGRKMQDT